MSTASPFTISPPLSTLHDAFHMTFDTITPFRVAVDLEPVLRSNDSTFTAPALLQTLAEEVDVVLYPRAHSTSDSEDGSERSFSSTSTAVATPNPDEDIENIAPFPFTFFVPHLKADRDEDMKASDSRERNYPSKPPLNMIVVPEPQKREVRAPLAVLYEKPPRNGPRASIAVPQKNPHFPLSSLSRSIFSSPRRRAIFSAEEKSLVHSLIRC
ncbi:hypothetical protein IW261DRAFT_1612724 [Armillaria novae-zelandiae]|uniref:Uncharacterized protein n=1 Tax=Armillaria novae-zelandiae TaxID=153914 RepID=A0AA39NNE4_9AGAR|nr:hypothetical protein IW261DRAFT_1612724 [Armillaria novae-zelandiae]